MTDNNMNNETSFQHSDMPILCASGCGFFGTAATMNLCSKCYRDQRLKEDQEASAMAAVKKSFNPPSPAPMTLVVDKKAVDSFSESPQTAAESSAAPIETTAAKVGPNRCGSCKKKVGVLGFKCRCGVTFCGSHRYPEEHDCQVDYKEAGKEAIAKANPVVVADKLTRF